MKTSAMEYQGDAVGSGEVNEEQKNTDGDFQMNVGESEFAQGTGNAGLGKNSRMFYKTKPCFSFRAGSCSFGSSCKYAHGLEELKKPRPTFQQPAGGNQSDKTRQSKRFREDQSISRESAAINLGPTTNDEPFQRQSYWKTRICHKWQTNGHCQFGDTCRFAHGLAELQKHHGGPVDSDGGVTSCVPHNGFEQSGTLPRPCTDVGSGPAASVYDRESKVASAPSQCSLKYSMDQRQDQRCLPRWKGPDKISRIYGDWIDEIDE